MANSRSSNLPEDRLPFFQATFFEQVCCCRNSLALAPDSS
jgi:hypothetical protein